MANSSLLEILVDHYASGKIKAAQDGDTEAAKELLQCIKESIVKGATKTPKDILDLGLCFIDLEFASYLFDALTRLEGGESAEHAFLLKKRRGAPSQEKENFGRDIWFAKAMAEEIARGKAYTIASGDLEQQIQDEIYEEYPENADEIINILSVSKSTIERAYNKFKEYLQ